MCHLPIVHTRCSLSFAKLNNDAFICAVWTFLVLILNKTIWMCHGEKFWNILRFKDFMQSYIAVYLLIWDNIDWLQSLKRILFYSILVACLSSIRKCGNQSRGNVFFFFFWFRPFQFEKSLDTILVGPDHCIPQHSNTLPTIGPSCKPCRIACMQHTCVIHGRTPCAHA